MNGEAACELQCTNLTSQAFVVSFQLNILLEKYEKLCPNTSMSTSSEVKMICKQGNQFITTEDWRFKLKTMKEAIEEITIHAIGLSMAGKAHFTVYTIIHHAYNHVRSRSRNLYAYTITCYSFFRSFFFFF